MTNPSIIVEDDFTLSWTFEGCTITFKTEEDMLTNKILNFSHDMMFIVDNYHDNQGIITNKIKKMITQESPRQDICQFARDMVIDNKLLIDLDYMIKHNALIEGKDYRLRESLPNGNYNINVYSALVYDIYSTHRTLTIGKATLHVSSKGKRLITFDETESST